MIYICARVIHINQAVSEMFGKILEFKKYLHSLNEELGRHRGREGKCSLCGAECWEIGMQILKC